jgi:hypothetical protein
MEPTRRTSNLHLVRLMCFIAVFLPNCTRCCPTGFGSCQCNWAWETCPATNNGCSGCGGSSSSGSGCNAATAEDPSLLPSFEASAPHMQAMTADATVSEPGGTLAFVSTDSGTFAVAAVGPNDEVRVVRVDASSVDEDPLVIRTTGVITLHTGDNPGRVVADGHGHALVALRDGGAVATIDPLTATVISRRVVCRSPHGIAVDTATDVMHVACGSGEIATVRLADGSETRRSSVSAALEDIALASGTVVASDGDSLFITDGGVFAPAGSRSLPETVLGTKLDVTATVSDMALLGDALAVVAGGDAYLRGASPDPLARVSGPGITHAVAMADVTGEGVTRRVLAIQTSTPRMVVFFTGTTPNAAAFEPVE